MEFLWQIFNLLPYRTNQYFTPNFSLGFLKELRRLENLPSSGSLRGLGRLINYY